MKRIFLTTECLWGLGLFLLIFGAYLPVLHGTFIWDDGVMVADNPMLRNGQGLCDFWLTTKAVDPLPVTMTALWLQWQGWGGHPFGYHVIDVLFHALSAFLLWRLLLRFIRPPRLAWVAAAVFGLHPVAVASAGWISEQKNTLSMVFYLASIIFYLRFTDNQKRAGYWLALCFYLLALLSKGSVVMLPVILLLIGWWQHGHISRKSPVRLVPFFLLSLAGGLGTIWIQNHKAIGGAMAADIHGAARLAAAGWSVWFYIWKALAPLNLCVIYPQWQIQSGSVVAWLPLLALVAVFVIASHRRKTWGRHLLLGLGCFVVTLFPVLGFFDMYFLLYSHVADHWQYLALPPLLALVIGGAGRLLPKAASCMGAGALLLLLFAGVWTRAGVYRTERSLWEDTVKKNPKAWMAWNNLGNALAAAGEAEPALAAYENALNLHPIFPDAESNLGNALAGKGDWADAIFHLHKAVEEEPRLAKFHFNYGVGLGGAGRLDEAVAEYQKALDLQPAYADVRNNLANVFFKKKNFSEALQQANLALQLNPALAEPHLNAAKALAALNRPVEAAPEFEQFLTMRPENAGARFEYGTLLVMRGELAQALPQFQAVVRLKPDEVAGHCNLGNTLAALKRLPEAIIEFRTALRLQPQDAQNQGNLANALFEQGNLDEAVEHYTESIILNPNDPAIRLNFAQALRQRGRRAEAVAQYREALRLKPGDPAIQQQLNAVLSQ